MSVSVRAPSIERNGKHIVVFRIEHMVFSQSTLRLYTVRKSESKCL